MLLRSARVRRPEIRIQKRHTLAEQTEQHPPGVGDDPPEPMVESDEHKTARSGKRGGGLEPEQRIRRMMQDAVADHEIEAARPEHRTKQVHLQEVDARQAKPFLELLTEPEGVDADVGTEDRPRCDAKEHAQLASPTPAFENASPQRDLLIEEVREQTAARLVHETADAVELIVVRERRLLIEGAYLLSHPLLGCDPFGRPKQERDVVLH